MTTIWRSASVILLLVLLSATPGRGGTGKFPYLSPLPGSSLVPVNSAVAFRTGKTFGGGFAAGGVSVAVVGRLSGAHEGNLVLSDDRRTLIYYPCRPFYPFETVTVSIVSPAQASDGGECDTTMYSFTAGHAKTMESGGGPPAPESEDRSLRVPRWDFSMQGRLAVDSLPPGFPSITVVADSGPPPLSLFLSNFPLDQHALNTPYLMTIGADASPRFARRMPEECFDFKRQPNGLFTYHDKTFGYFFALDSTFAVVDSFRCGNEYPTDDHELRLLPNGHALLLGYDLEPFRMDTVVQGGDSSALVYGLILQELDRSKNVVFQWRSWDHFRITDAIGIDLTQHMIDYVHGNAIEVDADSNIILSSRHLSEITKINRQTGEIMWRWGGKNNQFTFIGDTTGFSYQHMIRRLPDGHWTLFDNGDYHAVPVSRAVEYVLDERQKTATLVWQYRHTPDIYSFAMGSVQRLADGNTLIGWGASNPSVSLVTPAGQTLLELSFPQAIYSYRAFGIEVSPLTSAVPVPQAAIRTPALGQNFPNPFNPTTTIRYALPHQAFVTLKVYNTLGQLVSTLVEELEQPGVHEAVFNGADRASGVYFYRIKAGQYVETKKLTLVR